MAYRRRLSSLTTDFWFLEIAALTASFLLLAALVWILIAYNGKEVFFWHGVTLNTWVAILSTASEATLALALAESISQWKWIFFSNKERRLLDFDQIDNASRGPWGSLKLLWHPGRAIALRLGAATVVIAMVIEPFAQLLVRYGQEIVFIPSNEVSIPFARRYSKGLEYHDELGEFHENEVTADADFAMQSAILYGLSQPLESSLQELTFNCPSSNCTWMPFDSLAVYSQCNNVTQMLTRNTSRADQWTSLDRGDAALFTGKGVKFELPNGLSIDNSIEFGNSNDSSKEAKYGVWMTTFGTGNSSRTCTLESHDTLIWSVTILRTRTEASKVWPALPLEALECGLYYCVKSFNSSVRNSTLFEEEKVRSDLTRAPESWGLVGDIWGSKLAHDLDGSPKGREMLSSIEFSDVYSIMGRYDLVLGHDYKLSQNAVDSISSFFQDRFTLDVNQSLIGSLNGFYMTTSQGQIQPSTMQAFYDSRDLARTFESLARCMSNAIRVGSDNSTVQIGESGVLKTYYRISWPWISLHCTVVFAGAGFCVATIFSTNNARVPVWKSSALAVLSRGPYVEGKLEGADSLSTLSKMAAAEKARLLGRHDIALNVELTGLDATAMVSRTRLSALSLIEDGGDTPETAYNMIEPNQQQTNRSRTY